MNRPLLAIVPGSPGFLGPELAAKAFAVAPVRASCRPLVVGSPSGVAAAAASLHLGLHVRPVASPAEARFEPDQIDLLDPGPGPAAALETARALARQGLVDGVVVGPGTGSSLAALALESDACWLMAIAGTLRVAYLTSGATLRDAIAAVTVEKVTAAAQAAAGCCRDLGIDDPRVGVFSLNPADAFGSEESCVIGPAVAAMRGAGFHAEGPLPAPIGALRALRGELDVLLAMHHDQGDSAIRLAGARTTIYALLGQPYVHTAVGPPGTDPGEPGTGDPASFVAAIRTAAGIAARRRQSAGPPTLAGALGPEAPL